VSIATPVSGAPYSQGQVVDSGFTCSEGKGGPGIASCLDQNGRASGAAIDTATTGAHTMTVTATSHDGQTRTASVSYTVAAPPPPVVQTPVLGDLRQAHASWREHGSQATTTHHNRPPVGTAFFFTLNQAATVKLVFTQTAAGRVIKIKGQSQCVAETKHNKQNRQCARMVSVASMSLNASNGANEIVFVGRVSPTHTLRPGRYTVTITATNASGASSKPQSLRFTIL
jgi:hypothetical protein